MALCLDISSVKIISDLSRGELGDSLGALRDGVLGKLTGEDQAHSGLDLARSESGLLVHASKLQEERRGRKRSAQGH